MKIVLGQPDFEAVVSQLSTLGESIVTFCQPGDGR